MLDRSAAIASTQAQHQTKSVKKAQDGVCEQPFCQVLQDKKSAQVELRQMLGEALNGVARSWEEASLRSQRLVRSLPSINRALFEAQLTAQQLQLQNELVSRGAETVTSSVKRLQQLGSN